MCPILPLNKNYLRNYLEPKNYLEVPEWQDDSWSGNCLKNKYFSAATCLFRIHVYRYPAGMDGTRRVTFSQRRGRHSFGQPFRATQPRTHFKKLAGKRQLQACLAFISKKRTGMRPPLPCVRVAS